MSANTTPVKVKKTDLSGTSTAYKVFAVVILIMLAIFFLFPLYWIVTGSFKSAIDINAKVPVWFPMNPTMGNYDKLFAKPAFLWLFNIVFISAMAMILTCITAAWLVMRWAKSGSTAGPSCLPSSSAPWLCPNRSLLSLWLRR